MKVTIKKEENGMNTRFFACPKCGAESEFGQEYDRREDPTDLESRLIPVVRRRCTRATCRQPVKGQAYKTRTFWDVEVKR